MKRDAASERQVQAAEPGASTWVSANAGSGKTRVLTDRVVRLLLEDVLPEQILCLTYTKAAASEMQNRLFKKLGSWAMKPDVELHQELNMLGVTARLTGPKLRQARTLFARAIEAPGGLKIQTIHSFCATLLRRFPLEAGVHPNFTEMDKHAATKLQRDCVEQMAQSGDAALVSHLANQISSIDFEEICSDIIKQKSKFCRTPNADDIYAKLSLTAGFSFKDLLAQVFIGGEAALLQRLISELETGNITDKKNAKKLAAANDKTLASLTILEQVFLTGEGARVPFSAKLGRFPTKKLQSGKLASDLPQIENWMRRVEAARKIRLSLSTAEKTVVAGQFGQAFVQRYEAQKQQRGWLDFDDLILKARDLLTDPALAQWVLYRLDGGIDHILVDEAQDTSPIQWQVIEKLTQEFTSGQGARHEINRTIFVVGDKKQSIYSFQGADATEFDRVKQALHGRISALGQPFQDLTLEYSFRSAEAILRLVDCIFDQHKDSIFSKTLLHRAFKIEMPGRVDLWPLITADETADETAWDNPVDRLGTQHHNVILARQIASEIKRMIDAKTLLPRGEKDDPTTAARPIRPGDFLVLVQRRSELFDELIRACKLHDLPIAGADRLKVGAELAVRDLLALLAFLATPEDSLLLAVVLKSPLFGWQEQQLFELAHGREEQFLWQTLRARRTTYPTLVSDLEELMGQTDFLRPYDLLERVLTRHGGRQKILARLGNEAQDGIDALLSQALDYEQETTPSLTGFLQRMQADPLEIKRQIDNTSDQIRIMTVHGAKGLEAPIVILPDTARRDLKITSQILPCDGQPLWINSGAERPAQVQELVTNIRDQHRHERDRLLYVAITRAEKWLIVAAAGKLNKDRSDWYNRVKAGLMIAGAKTHSFAFGAGMRLQTGDWPGLKAVAESIRVSAHTPTLPSDLQQPAPAVERSKPPLSPSDLGGAKALSDERGTDTKTALMYGDLIHLLLEHLPVRPKSDWPSFTTQLLASVSQDNEKINKGALLAEVTAVLTHPGLTEIFAHQALTEVSITAKVSKLGDRRVHGTIDRLLVSKDSVLAIDFKSNAAVPDKVTNCPEGILRQMAAYSEALQQVYPKKIINMAILWTKTAELMAVPAIMLSAALDRAEVA